MLMLMCFETTMIFEFRNRLRRNLLRYLSHILVVPSGTVEIPGLSPSPSPIVHLALTVHVPGGEASPSTPSFLS